MESNSSRRKKDGRGTDAGVDDFWNTKFSFRFIDFIWLFVGILIGIASTSPIIAVIFSLVAILFLFYYITHSIKDGYQ